MGLLDKWTKKKKKEQLTAVEQAGDVSSAEKSEVSKKIKKDKKVVSETTKETARQGGGAAYRVVLHPLISEKTAHAEALNHYTFVVDKRATKTQVKHAIKEIYGIMPRKVRMMHVEGKGVRFGYARGRRSDWKKAIVLLPAGKSIHIHEGV